VHEPTPEQYNPPLTWRAHAWRTALAIAISAAVWPTTAVEEWRQARPLFWLDLAVAVACLVLSFYRRRWPLTVAVVINLAAVMSFASAGPGTLAAVSLATRRVVWQVVLVGVVSILAGIAFPVGWPSLTNDPLWVTFAVGFAFTIAMLVWGMYVGSRRELLWTLRDRAERAEAEQELRVRQSRSNERARIAREMHDVLAHRISLITMHAGALAYRRDLTAEEMRETAELIQAKSHEALTDLRHVLGVLRSEDGAATMQEAPQPTFEDLSALILEARESGMRISYDDRVQDAAQMPEQVGRTTYRIVQEGLTNARKHAPDTTVLVRLAGSAEAGVDISIRNPARSLHSPRTGADSGSGASWGMAAGLGSSPGNGPGNGTGNGTGNGSGSGPGTGTASGPASGAVNGFRTRAGYAPGGLSSNGSSNGSGRSTNGSGTPGAGLGLVGLGERAKLAGGRLATRVEGDMFELHSWLPWTS
jgi:signal transduction histidine kinase